MTYLVRFSKVFAASALLVLLVMVFMRIHGFADGNTADYKSIASSATEMVTVGVFALVGIALVLKRPNNVIGWLLIVPGTAAVFSEYALYTLLARPESSLPGGEIAVAIDISMWFVLVYTVLLLLLTFPSGHIASRWWRRFAWITGVGLPIAVVLTVLTMDGFDPPYEQFQNPWLIEGLDQYVDLLSVAFLFPLMISVPVAAIDLFIRFRRSRGEERQQFRWLALSGVTLVAYFPVYALLGTTHDELAYALFTIALATLPVSIGIAVLKYRLYEIDSVVSRTVAYGLLTAILAAAYFGIVVSLQAILRELSGGSDLAIALTTLVVAGLFLPARRQVQTLVDRRFNRRAYDVALTIDAFSGRLRDQIDLDTLRYELLAVVDETMQPHGTSLWLRRGHTS